MFIAVLFVITAVTPAVEHAGADDCDVSQRVFSSTGKIRPYWVETWGDAADQWLTGVDAAGEHVYAVGAVFDSEEAESFLLKYTTDGDLVWDASLADSGDVVASDVAVQGGNVYVTGGVIASGDNVNVFLSRYTDAGEHVWTKTWGGGGADVARGLAIHGTDIYLVGTSGSFGAVSGDIVVLKFDTDGTFRWYSLWGGLESEEGSRIAATESGVYVTGVTDSYDKGGGDAVCAKFDPDGDLVWAKTWGGTDAEWGTDIIEFQGYVFITGYTRSYAGPVFLVKYDPDGNTLWERRWGGEGSDTGLALTAYDGTVYVTGETYSYGEGSGDVFLLKYAENGDFSWAKTWGGEAADAAGDIDAESERLYLAGATESEGAGGADAFILKCNLEGRWLSHETRNVHGLFDRFGRLRVFGRIVLSRLDAAGEQTVGMSDATFR
jgi:hypothetical protein